MHIFSELSYERPCYEKEQEVLINYKNEIMSASTYEEIRRVWLSMKESMQYIDYLEQLAYTRYLCGISNEFYKEEVRIQDIKYPQLAVLMKECDKAFLDSEYIAEFGLEFGDQIVNQLRNSIMLSDSQIISLQSDESNLKTEYITLLSKGQKSEEISDEYYRILNNLIKVRTEIAQALGFKNYIEMAYRMHGRFDYGQEEIAAFRKQIQQLITPACAELRKSETINYPKTSITDTNELITVIKNMFCDISEESGEYIKHILTNKLIDMEDRPNKRPDWFSCFMLPYLKTPFIAGCFHGDGLEANYLIHELGHGYAFYSAAHSQKLYEYHRAVTSVNEIHSKTMEHFAYPYLDSIFGTQKRAYIRNHLFHSFDNLPYRCAIDEFEHAIYTDTSLSRVQRCELWSDIEHKYMPWRIYNQEAIKHGTYWPNQTHLFTHPFYYIEYNIAQMSVFEFYGRSKDNYSQAWKDYSRLCHTGGSLNYLKLLDVGGLTNPFSENAINKICKPVLNELFSC